MKAGGREQIARSLKASRADRRRTRLLREEIATCTSKVSATSSITSASARWRRSRPAEDRVCVLNILGGESSEVTPVGHAYSGGNVVFGTSPGRRGQVLETPHRRHPGLQQRARGPGGRPPLQLRRRLSAALRRARRRRRTDPGQPGSAARSSSSPRRCRCTTAREIRAMGQQNGIDIFGGNSLGVADAWNEVRIGGALGGDSPAEALRQGLDRHLLQLRQLHHHDRARTCAWPAGARPR